MMILALIAIAAVAIHGYHLGADDAAIYIPGIKKAADPTLFPSGAEFFMSHAHLSLFANIVGGSARLTRAPMDLAIFAWHFACILLLLVACRRLLSLCFVTERARWAGIAVVAGALSVPVAGTALVIMDPYLTARSLSTPMTVFAVASCAAGQWKRALLWVLATALIHPQMAAYGAAFVAIYGAAKACESVSSAIPQAGPVFYAGAPLLLTFEAPSGPAREALLSRTYFFVFTWTWYEWVGVFAPLAILWWFSKRVRRNTTPAFIAICRALVPLALLATAAAVFLELSPRLENFARLQPMRALHIVYVVFFALFGAVLGEYALKDSVLRWALLFTCLAASMCAVQLAAYPESAHVEWPGTSARNPWISAFLWIRSNTPKNALFALDPRYMLSPGEDEHGFRAIAERSALADEVKDSGAASLFPSLADEWKSEVVAEDRDFAARDFRELAKDYHVNWVVTMRPLPAGLRCPYRNDEVLVCRVSR